MDCLRSTVGAALVAGLFALAGCNSDAKDPVADTPSPTYLVTTAGTHVAMSPITGSFPVKRGETIRIAVTAEAGFTLASAVGGTCPEGVWNTGAYTTGPITGSCTLDFSAGVTVFTVTPTADPRVTISPDSAQTVVIDTTQTFALTVTQGYVVSVGGTCAAGILTSGAYVTGAITADCTVNFAAPLGTVDVTVAGDAHLSLSPDMVQTIAYGATLAVTATASNGYTLSPSVGGTCALGSFDAGAYTTGAVTANCSVTFSSFLNWSGVRQQGVAGRSTEGMDVATDRAGNAYVAGYTSGDLGGTPVIGNYDAFVSKYDRSGNLLWMRKQGATTKETFMQAVAVDAAGSVFVSGWTNGGLNGNPTPNRNDYFVAKYAADGTLLWVKQEGGADGQLTEARGLALDTLGNIYVSGMTTTALNGNVQNGIYDGFVAKYGTDGTLLWLKQFGGAGLGTMAERIAVDAAGNAFVSAATHGALPGNIQQGNIDYALAKYDTNGNLQWLRQSGGVPGDETAGFGVAVTPSGEALLVGVTTGSVHGQPQTGYQDYFLVRFDTDGNLVSYRQWGMPQSYARARGVVSDLAGNALIIGYTADALDGVGMTGLYDAFVAKYAIDGTLTWLRQLGAAGALTFGNGITMDAFGGIFVGGRTDGGLAGNTRSGSLDSWLAKYSAEGVLQ